MTRLEWLLKRFGLERAPDSEAEQRFVRHVANRAPGGPATCNALRHLPRPTPEATERFVRRLEEIPLRETEEHRLRIHRLLVPAGVIGAVTVLLGLLLGLPSSSLDVALVASPGDPVSHTLRHVALDMERGHAHLQGSEQAPDIRLLRGRIRVDVEPEQGIDLTVSTREARVRVVGTAFEVERDALETRIHVERGAVEVTCAGAAPLRLEAGEQTACLPDDPSRLAARATALYRQGASADQVLATTERGLDRAEPGSLEACHLQALSANARHALGDSEAAWQAVHAWEQTGCTVRTPEMTRLGFALSPQPCTWAERHHEPLLASATTPGERVRLADCLQTTDPERARTLLQQAADEVTSPPDRQAIEARLATLGSREKE